jgi:threonine dehydrogenase-like Zn-dependent dehydrogenase
MAREIVALSPDELEIREVEDSEPGEGEVRVRSAFGAAKHGTEMASVKGYGLRGRLDPDLRLFVEDEDTRSEGARVSRVGNMVVGPVETVGPGVKGLKVGDTVAVHSSFRDSVVKSASRCWKLEEGITWKDAVCLDPADFAMGAVRDGQVRIGDAVAVFGLGAIGLMVIQLAKLAGAYPVIGLDPLENRRAVGQVCGADLVIDPMAVDAGLELKKSTGNRGVDVVVEYSGNVHAMQAALRGVAFGGNVVAGAYPPPYGAGLDLGAEAHMNRPNIVFSRACSEPNRDHPRWDEDRIFDNCRRLFREGKISGEPIVTPVVAFEEIVSEYPKIMSDPGSNVKLGCRFG